MQVSHAEQKHEEDDKSEKTYEGAQVWRTILRGPSDILLMKRLIDNQDISIWYLTPKRADFLVQAENKLKVNRHLSSQSLSHTVVILDLQRRLDALQPDPVFWSDKTLRMGHRLSWTEFPTLKIIDEYIDYLKENYASICKVINIGHTAENRTIKMLKISNGNPSNKAILVISGLHAREWIAITSALYLLDHIVTSFDQLPRYMANKEWIIIPLLNPDGFKYTQTHDRLWRKNRRKLNKCTGVDINRNFAIDWDIAGITVKNECNEAYSGPHPFSEAESIALRVYNYLYLLEVSGDQSKDIEPSISSLDVARDAFGNWDYTSGDGRLPSVDLILKSQKSPEALIDLHSYGQLILYPWSAKPGLAADRDLHKATAKQMTKAIYNATRHRYKPGVTYHTIYPATGDAIDWIYSAGVPQSYALEVGDDDPHGFLPLPDRIIATGKDTLAATKALTKSIDSYYITRGQVHGPWFKK